MNPSQTLKRARRATLGALVLLAAAGMPAFAQAPAPAAAGRALLAVLAALALRA